MAHLDRIILINAAGFDYLEFPVGGHCQVVGVNGHGKSTLLRTVLFFYLGTNDKAPYALHETKADFVSHYLGEPPSYLIYEVRREGNQPSYHIVVTRPAGRIQFHFVDAPFRRDYYVDGNFVQPIEAAHEKLREAECHFDTVSSYDEFIHRIYGVVPSAYAVFRPAAKNTGQVSVLPRIISGIFTVSQLDADKLKSALTCGVRRDALATELDLVQLKGHLENFRRVNRAVKTYLRNEQLAEDLVDLAAEFEGIKSERQRAIEELVRLAKRLPEERKSLEEQVAILAADESLATTEFETQSRELAEMIRKLGEEIAVVESQIKQGREIRTEYAEREIVKKSDELESIPILDGQLRIAKQEYASLTAKYEDERQQKEHLLATVQQGWTESRAQFGERKRAIEREAHEASERLNAEERESRVAIEEERADATNRLAPQKKSLEKLRELLDADWRAFADLKPPAEIAETERRLKDTDRKLQEDKSKQEQFRNEITRLKERSKAEQEKRDRDAQNERTEIERKIATLNGDRSRVEAELASFDASLARFFQTTDAVAWENAAKALNRETLFKSAEEIGAAPISGASSGVWGIEFSTECLPSPAESYNRDDLADRLRKIREDIKNAMDQSQAIQERYLSAHAAAEKTTSQALSELGAQLATSIELRNKLTDDAVWLENHLVTLRSRHADERQKRREELDSRDTRCKKAASDLRMEEGTLSSRFGTRLREMEAQIAQRKAQLEKDTNDLLASVTKEETAARQHFEEEKKRIEAEFQRALTDKGVDPTLVAAVQKRVSHFESEIQRISAFRDEVAEYRKKKQEWIDPLPSWEALCASLRETHGAKESAQAILKEKHQSVIAQFKERREKLENLGTSIKTDENASNRFLKSARFMQEWGYFDRDELPAAAFYQPGAANEYLLSAENADEHLERIGKQGDKNARAFLNRFDPETLDRRVLGLSPIHEEHFNWFLFVGGELKPFVNNRGISAMKRIQTQEFEQLIRNICNKNADFREGIRQVNQTADLVQSHLRENNFVDVLDSIELKVERVDSPLSRTLNGLEEFADVSFSTDQDLFGKQADRSQIDRAIEAFERLLREIDNYRGKQLLLTDYFDFLIRVHENGHDMGWRKSLDHIGSTGTDYLVKMLIYLSLIEVYRARAIDPKSNPTVHCVMDETGVLAAKYVRSVLDYAATRGIILVTAGHSQQTTGFDHWILVRKTGQRFAGQTILRKILRCD